MKIPSIILCLFLALSTQAQTFITATVTVTNASGTVNGNTITVNGTQRLFTNAVVNSATQITTANNIGGAASNLFLAYVIKREDGMDISTSSTNAMILSGFPGFPLTVSLGGSWGTVSLSTQSIGGLTVVRVPMSGVGSVERTNVESGLVDYLNDNKGTNIVATNAPFFISYVNTNGDQQISGAKTFNGSINGVVGNLTNGTWTNPTFTNGQNFGNPFRSPGGGTGSEQFGLGARASTNAAAAFGDNSSATGIGSSAFGDQAAAANAEATALGAFTIASGDAATAIGATAVASGDNTVALGPGSTASANSAIAIGNSATSAFVNSTAIGSAATTTANHQIMMGTAAEYTHFAGGVLFKGAETNFTGAGTNTITGQLAFTRANVTGLANGGNASIPISTNVNVFISGPTAAFSVDSIAGGSDGRVVRLTSRVGQTWTIPNESGFDTLNPTNRIQTGTGATVTLNNNPAWATFYYDTTATRWILEAHSN